MMDERFASSERMGNLNIYSYINIDFVQLFCYVPLKEESKKERERETYAIWKFVMDVYFNN